MKLAWKHFYVLWIFKFSLFLCLILSTACRRTSLFSSLSIPMRIFSWWAKNPFHSSPWPWLELFGKSEHEEDILSAILDGWIGLDVEVVGDVEADDQTDDLLLLCTWLSCWHIVPEKMVSWKKNCSECIWIYLRSLAAVVNHLACSGGPIVAAAMSVETTPVCTAIPSL